MLLVKKYNNFVNKVSNAVKASGLILAPLIIKLDSNSGSLIAINSPIIPPSLKPYIIGFSIRCRSTDSYYPHNSLFFTSHYDYGVVELKDCNGETLKVHAPDLKQIVEGFIEDEILDSQEEFDDWDK